MATSLDNFYISTYGPTGLNILRNYWACSEVSGAIVDSVAAQNGVAGLNITYGQASILPTTDGATCLLSANAATGVVTLVGTLAGYPKSYECWFKYTTVGGGQQPLFQNGSPGVWVGWFGGGVGFGLFTIGGGTANYTTAFTPVANTVYHMVLATDGTAAGTKIYINAVSRAMTTSGAPAASSGTVSGIMGAPSLGSSSPEIGYCEKMCVYNAVLTSTQVTNNYNAGLIGPPAAGGPFVLNTSGNITANMTGGYQG